MSVQRSWSSLVKFECEAFGGSDGKVESAFELRTRVGVGGCSCAECGCF